MAKGADTYVKGKTTSTTLTKDIKSGELEKKIVEADA
jgi:hypothetical protein